MNNKIDFKYFYGNEADQYSFYRIPKLLIKNDYFKGLSSDAKILYGLMLDRMSLSIKNQWFDEKNRAYIYFSIEDIMDLLNCGRNKAVKSLQELDDESGIGLIEKRRQGFGKANIIYVKSFLVKEEVHTGIDSDAQKFIEQTTGDTSTSTEVYKTNFLECEKQTSRSPENKLQEVYNSNCNYNNINNTDFNNTESNPIVSADDGSDDDEIKTIDAYIELIKENIEYNSLIITHARDKEVIDGIVDLMLEVVISKNEKTLIARNWYPTALIKSKFMKLNYCHIEYILACLSSNTTQINNIKKYLMASLFNAPTTMESYYSAAVNHDMPQFAVK